MRVQTAFRLFTHANPQVSEAFEYRIRRGCFDGGPAAFADVAALQRHERVADELGVAVHVGADFRVRNVAAAVARCQNGAADALGIGLVYDDVAACTRGTQRQRGLNGGHKARRAASYDCDSIHACDYTAKRQLATPASARLWQDFRIPAWREPRGLRLGKISGFL